MDSSSSSIASETIPERQNVITQKNTAFFVSPMSAFTVTVNPAQAQEPVLPSPNTSSNRDAAISADPARIDESNPSLFELMKSFSEHMTGMKSVFSTIIKKYEELERENEGLRREAELMKAKLNDQESQLHTIQTEMNTQKNELENLRKEKNNLEI